MANAYALVDHRDGWRCRICAVHTVHPMLALHAGYSFEHHHIRKRSTHPELRTDPANIVLLCASCHAAVERKEVRIIGTNADGPLEFTRA